MSDEPMGGNGMQGHETEQSRMNLPLKLSEILVPTDFSDNAGTALRLADEQLTGPIDRR